MCSYLKNRKPRVAINNSASTTKTVAAEIPKGSADDPFLFNVFTRNLVLFIQETILCNYAYESSISIVEAVRNILRNC